MLKLRSRCAIAGMVGKSLPHSAAETVARMADSIRHRGALPGQLVRHTAVFAPTSTGAGLLLDGAIYGTICSPARGLTPDAACAGTGAEESGVPKNAYDLKKLEGIYALVYPGGDGERDGARLFVARDPFGLRPLYYARQGDTYYFASEVKALLGAEAGLHVKPFPPGHFFTLEDGFVLFCDPDTFGRGIPTPPVAGPEETARSLRELLMKAVQKRLPGAGAGGVAVLLSGGLDSSVVAAACVHLGLSVKTFSVGTRGSQDLLNARRVAEHLRTEHHEYVYDLDEMIAILPRVIYALESFDAPLVRSAIANYLACREAARHGAQETLCGEGSDELFAGYDYLRPMSGSSALAKELERLLREGHTTGFQRVDRMNMTHSLDYHLPFMDFTLIAFARRLPDDYKIGPREKWILRKAFEGMLPEEVVWRKKAKFSHGAGSAEMLHELADAEITDDEFAAEREIAPGHALISKEELYYYRIFRRFFPIEQVVETVGRTRQP